MIRIFISFLKFFNVFFRSRYSLGLEILALRQQLGESCIAFLFTAELPYTHIGSTSAPFRTRPFPEPLMLGHCDFKTLDLRAIYYWRHTGGA
jgi:hypothetical protein